VFGVGARVVLDIGFGGGEGLVEMAAARPDECVIGVEVHTPGVAKVIEAVEAGSWTHVRVVEGDVLDFLPRLSSTSLVGICIWFPDPWPKQRQQHRRLVRPEVVTALVDRLGVGGTLHVASDIADYVRHTERVVAGEPRLRGGVVERPAWRPLTRFEQRGLREGRTATDLLYERIC
jgi:tRNA (guanine-N7-)-methyltransferase